MYRAMYETTREVLITADLRNLIKNVCGDLRFCKSHLRGDDVMEQEVTICRYDENDNRWKYEGSMYMHYYPRIPELNWVSLRWGSNGYSEWAKEA